MAHAFWLRFVLVFLAELSCSCLIQAQGQTALPTNHTSKIAFQLPETGLITESIAYDSQSRTFYVGSVHERQIFSYTAKKETRSFSLPSDSLWGVFGLKVAAPQRILWACSSALPQAKGNTKATDGTTALVAYDLTTKRLLHTYPVTADGKPHLLGDLTIAKNGTVYATDSRTPCLYRLTPGDQTVKPFLTDSLFYSLQGLALSDDEQTLFVADYRRGLLAITLATKIVTRIPWPTSSDLSGIDGLYFYHNSLIAIQNKAKPFKVIRIHLSQTPTTIDRVETLETGHPLISEPTLGVVVGKQFYYIANSQWDAFDNVGKPVPNFPAEKPTILVLDLD